MCTEDTTRPTIPGVTIVWEEGPDRIDMIERFLRVHPEWMPDDASESVIVPKERGDA